MRLLLSLLLLREFLSFISPLRWIYSALSRCERRSCVSTRGSAVRGCCGLAACFRSGVLGCNPLPILALEYALLLFSRFECGAKSRISRTWPILWPLLSPMSTMISSYLKKREGKRERERWWGNFSFGGQPFFSPFVDFNYIHPPDLLTEKGGAFNGICRCNERKKGFFFQIAHGLHKIVMDQSSTFFWRAFYPKPIFNNFLTRPPQKKEKCRNSHTFKHALGRNTVTWSKRLEPSSPQNMKGSYREAKSWSRDTSGFAPKILSAPPMPAPSSHNSTATDVISLGLQPWEETKIRMMVED